MRRKRRESKIPLRSSGRTSRQDGRTLLAFILIVTLVVIFIMALSGPAPGVSGQAPTNTPPPLPTDPPPTKTPPPLPTNTPTITPTPGKVDPDLLTPQAYLPVTIKDATPTAAAPAGYP